MGARSIFTSISVTDSCSFMKLNQAAKNNPISTFHAAIWLNEEFQWDNSFIMIIFIIFIKGYISDRWRNIKCSNLTSCNINETRSIYFSLTSNNVTRSVPTPNQSINDLSGFCIHLINDKISNKRVGFVWIIMKIAKSVFSQSSDITRDNSNNNLWMTSVQINYNFKLAFIWRNDDKTKAETSRFSDISIQILYSWRSC